MSPATVLSSRAIMDAFALPRGTEPALWAIATAAAAIMVVSLVLRYPPKLSTLTTRFRLRAKPSTATSPPGSVPTCNGGDSGYEGSETLSDREDGGEVFEEDDPNCNGTVEEDIDDENYDLRRALRLCREASTPRRAPASPYSKDFEVYTTFLSETQKKARYRDVGRHETKAQ